MKDKKTIFIGIGVALLAVIIIVFFALKGNKTTTTTQAADTKMNTIRTAEEIYEDYASIVYGKTKTLSDSEIIEGGTYDITGTHKCLHIISKEDVRLNLSNATITCNNGPAIYVEDADSVDIVLEGNNKITAKTTDELNGAIYSTDDLILEGDGTLELESNQDGIVSKDTLIIVDGTYNLTTGDDGIRGKDIVAILDGNITISSEGDGIKATNEDGKLGYVVVDNGRIKVDSGNDVIQAETYININGGEIDGVAAKGSGTTLANGSAKGLKAGSQVVVKDGTITLNTAEDAIHTSGSVFLVGGTVKLTTGDDAVHADNLIQITKGDLEITKCREGLEASTIDIQGGTMNITANDDGINGTTDDTTKTGEITISGGTIRINSKGDGIDCNGAVEIKDGTIYVESTSEASETALDHDGELKISGGTVIAVAKSMGPNDIGETKATIPTLIAGVSGRGTISLGTISYTPTMDHYKYLVIASKDLKPEATTFTYGETSETVTLTEGVTQTGNTTRHSGGRTRGQNTQGGE